MANENLTIFQRLSKVLGPDGAKQKQKQPEPVQRYNIGKGELLKTDSKAEFEKAKLQGQQNKYLGKVWKKVETGLFQQSINYETTRIASYADFEAMEFYPLIGAALDILSEESCTIGDKGRIMNIYSDSTRVKGILEDLFFNRLDLHTTLPMFTRNACKFGDNFVFLNVDSTHGIIGAKQMPNYEMERRETGLFDMISGRETANSEEATNSYDKVKFFWRGRDVEFNTWQMAHFRMLGDDRRLPYGTCLKGDSYIETKDGYKEIKNINVGDEVYSFDIKKQERVTSKVLNTVNSGEKTCYKLSTKHNYIDASKEHKIMFYNDETKSFEYKNTLDFKIGDILVTNKEKIDGGKILIDKSAPEDYLKSQTYSEKNKYWNNVEELIPDFVSDELAELFGFLIGDGGIDRNSIYFALGVEKYIDDKIIDYLIKFTGREGIVKQKNNHKGEIINDKYVIHSKLLVTILRRLGFYGVSHTKRIPEWVFKSENHIKESFLNGLYLADGSIYVDKWNCSRFTFELANEALIKDIKTLIQSLGYKSGKIGCRDRTDKDLYIDGRKVINISKSYVLNYYHSKNKQTNKYNITNRITDNYILEPIISIEEIGNYETYDIYVENENHNFYANGIVVHNSHLEKARRSWKQLIMSEDAMLTYRVTRAPERRVYKIFVGNIDDNDVEAYVNAIADRFKRTPIVDPQTGQMDLRYNQLPVWKNTPIPLLDGRTITIEELAKEYNEGKENWVYSIQDKTHQIVPGKVKWCGMNYTADEMVKVWLDDDTYVVTAKEHPFVMRDGSKKRADELKENESLMPFYTKININGKSPISKYETVFNPNSGKFEKTHRIIGETITKEIKEHNTIHHKNFNKYDNSPTNLVWVDFHEHKKMHSDLAKSLWANVEFREIVIAKLSASTKKNWENGVYDNNSQKLSNTLKKKYESGEFDHIRKTSSNNITIYNKSEKKRLRNIELAKEQNWGNRFIEYNNSDLHTEHNIIRKEAQLKDWSDPIKKELRSKAMQIKFDDFIWSSIRTNIISGNIINRKTLLEYINHNLIEHLKSINKNERLNKLNKISREIVEGRTKENGFKTITEFISEQKKNHKVKKIEFIGGDDVYCMTVIGDNEEDDRHNFATKSMCLDGTTSESGVFVGNSNDQDYFIPVRSEDAPNPIDTLPGACISLDTRIPLLDGRTLELREIIKEWDNGNRNLWVYSCDPNTGSLAVLPITWAGITRKDTEVLKITLDNGKEIISTPDHKFVHRTKGFTEAKDLIIGDSLMPFYEKLEPINKNQEIWDNDNSKWVSTHKLISEVVQLNEFIYEINEKKTIIDHEDYKKTTKELYNHKIVNIEHLKDKQDTGTITVDGNEIYHNYHTFALESGVFIKNSNLSDIADIEFLRSNLFTALRVPKSFLGFDDATGEGKNLALQDIRFSRTINKIQQSMLQELNKIAIIHLTVLGFDDDIDNFTLTLNNPSTQAEMLKVEHMQQKVTLYKDAVSDAGNGFGAMSMTKAKRDILGWSDDEIKEDLLEQRMEKSAAAELANSSNVIKHTGMFDEVDRIYGDYKLALKGGGGAPSEGEEAKGGSGGLGGSFGGGGTGGEDLDFGEELEGGEEAKAGAEAGAEEEAVSGEEATAETEAGEENAGGETLAESINKAEKLLIEEKINLSKKLDERTKKYKNNFVNRLIESLNKEGKTSNEKVKIYDKNLKINENIEGMIKDIDKMLDE